MMPHRLASMSEHAIAYDRETHLIQPGLPAPPPVLGSAAEYTGQGICGVLLDKQQSRDLFAQMLDDPSAIICVANGVFDFLVEVVDAARLGKDIIGQVFELYDPQRSIVRGYCDGRVFDVQLAEALHAIAQGHLGKHALTRRPIVDKDTGRSARYNLDLVTYEVLGREDAKVNDRFRHSYYQFDDWPLERLPYEARKYPVDDACNTLEDALAQAGHLPSVNAHEPYLATDGFNYCKLCSIRLDPAAPHACMRKQPRRNLHDLARQAYFAWAAYVGAAWGFNVDQTEVDKLEKKYTDLRAKEDVPFVKAGILRENGTENQNVLKGLVAAAYGARDVCPTCAGTCKVPSPATNGKTKINCDDCDGTGLRLPPTVPRSEKGGIRKDHDTLQESGEDLLVEYGAREGKKILSTSIPMMRRGRACNVCGWSGAKTRQKKPHADWCTAQNGEAGYRPIPLILSIDPLKESGRAATEDGIDSLPRKGGVRECFKARSGYVLSSTDYTAGELVTVSWICLKLLGYSRLAEVMNRKMDPHLALGGTMLGVSYDEMYRRKKAGDKIVADVRQGAKNSNFGFWGGMAELTFTLRKRSEKGLFTPCPNGPSEDAKGNRGYDGFRPCILMDHADRCGVVKLYEYNEEPCVPVCKACVESARRLREFFKKQWLEANDYFALIKKLIANDGPSGTPEIVQMVTNRVRGGMGFCDAANTLFQGLLADAMKDAYCQIQRECCARGERVRSSEMMDSKFNGMESPLYGSRAIKPFHDETLAEHPESVAPWAVQRISECMIESLRWKCPELYHGVQAPPALMRCLYKGAEPVWERGRMKDGKVDHSEPADEYDRLLCWEP